jgi:hypothetical protein
LATFLGNSIPQTDTVDNTRRYTRKESRRRRKKSRKISNDCSKTSMSTYVNPLVVKSIGNNCRNQEVSLKLNLVYNNHSMFFKGIDIQLDMSRKSEQSC